MSYFLSHLQSVRPQTLQNCISMMGRYMQISLLEEDLQLINKQ